MHVPKSKTHNFGGAALEYILVSTFAAVVTMGALGVLGNSLKSKLDQINDAMTTDELFEPFDP